MGKVSDTRVGIGVLTFDKQLGEQTTNSATYHTDLDHVDLCP